MFYQKSENPIIHSSKFLIVWSLRSQYKFEKWTVNAGSILFKRRMGAEKQQKNHPKTPLFEASVVRDLNGQNLLYTISEAQSGYAPNI